MSFVQYLLERSQSCFCVGNIPFGEERVEEKTQREEELSNTSCIEGYSFLDVRPAGECQAKDQEN